VLFGSHGDFRGFLYEALVKSIVKKSLSVIGVLCVMGVR